MNKNTILKTACGAAILGSAAVSISAMATAHLESPAAAIQISSYGLVSPVLFYTGSVCSNQHLNLDDSASVDAQKLLWAVVLAAKSTGGKLSFDYDYNGDVCIIRSFSVTGS